MRLEKKHRETKEKLLFKKMMMAAGAESPAVSAAAAAAAAQAVSAAAAARTAAAISAGNVATQSAKTDILQKIGQRVEEENAVEAEHEKLVKSQQEDNKESIFDGKCLGTRERVETVSAESSKEALEIVHEQEEEVFDENEKFSIDDSGKFVNSGDDDIREVSFDKCS